MVLALLRERDMGERDAHLRAATAIEQMHGITPLTSQLRAEAKEHRRNQPHAPDSVCAFVRNHEDLGHVLVVGPDELIALDAQTNVEVGRLPCRDVGRLAYAALRATWLEDVP